jgi:hydroxymethylbilane synthase
MKNNIVIGTRGSKLALWQANYVKREIERLYPDVKIDLKIIKTKGDIIRDVPLSRIGGKGLFVKEIEESLIRGDIDIAVHSMKDLPTILPDSLHISAVTEREDPRDILISRNGLLLKDLPNGANIGTSSLRRQAQLLHIRPDLNPVSLRGNLDTRIKKLTGKGLDAIIVAYAGVLRMKYEDKITEYLPFLPAIGQGALGIESRINNKEINYIVKQLDHFETNLAIKCERSFLKRLEGGCQVPIAGFAEVNGDQIKMTGLVGSVDGKNIIKESIEGYADKAEELGIYLAETILSKGGDSILREVYGK